MWREKKDGLEERAVVVVATLSLRGGGGVELQVPVAAVKGKRQRPRTDMRGPSGAE